MMPKRKMRLVIALLLIPMLSFSLLSVAAEDGPEDLEAAFTYSPPEPYVNQEVTFNGSESTGNITSYHWTFGDNTTGFDPLVSHIYTAAGTYTVTLNITDTQGLWDIESQDIEVHKEESEPEEPEEPEAKFTFTPRYPYVNETVTFDASESDPKGGEIVSYEWNFGDGNITTVPAPAGARITHCYTAVGTYLVTLNITDSEGLWATETRDIDVIGQKYKVTLTVQSVVTGEILFQRTFKGEEEDTTVEVPELLYEMIVTQFGTDTFTTPFSIFITTLAGSQVLNFTVTSEPPGLTITYKETSNGDLDDNDIVNILDIVRVAVAYGSTLGAPNYDLQADLDFDFDIDILDIAIVAAQFRNTYYSTTATVEGTITLENEEEYPIAISGVNFTASFPRGMTGDYDASFEGEANVSETEICFVGEMEIEGTEEEYEFWVIFIINNTYSETDLPWEMYDAEGELTITITGEEIVSGLLVVKVGDAPASLDELFLRIDAVQVHRKGSGNETWKDIRVVATEPFDLLKLNETSTVLAAGELLVGNYTEIRLHIAEAWATIDGISNQTLEIPNDWLMIKVHFTIEELPVTEIVIDIDVNPEPIVNARILLPVAHATVEYVE